MTVKMITQYMLVLGLLVFVMGAANAGDPIKGQKMYEVHCQACHGERGLPQVPYLPNFSMGEGLMKSDMALLTTIKNGAGVMPAFNGILSDTEILDIVAHIRTFF